MHDLDRLKGWENKPTTLARVLEVLAAAERPLLSREVVKRCDLPGVPPKDIRRALCRLETKGMVETRWHRISGSPPPKLWLLKEEYL